MAKGKPENPLCAGMTAQEKKAFLARKFQEENREEYREYQRNYQRAYVKQPDVVLPRVIKIIAELEARLEREHQYYMNKTEKARTRLAEALKEKEQLEQAIELIKINGPTIKRRKPRGN